MRNDQPNEVFRRADPQRLHSDVIVANGRASHRREKNDVRSGQREATRRLRHHQVITDEHANGAEVLMGGRIGDSIEFYYLDTAPMLKFVLESGSGHAIDLKPTRMYP